MHEITIRQPHLSHSGNTRNQLRLLNRTAASITSREQQLLLKKSKIWPDINQVRLLRRRRHSSKQVLEPNIRVQTVERWVDSQVRYSKRTLIESAVKPEERLIFVASICIGNGVCGELIRRQVFNAM